ncbi:MAG: AI-2E family transporter, partial [Acidimicrobiales bacterium]|nr:AI-2E family transporter [Acidimicrobiales bacterium]
MIKVPDGTDPVAAMALACAGPTLVHALERRPVKLGETVIVQGSGPVGLAAAAMARLSGAARVIIVGGPKHRLDLAARCGIGDIHIDITAGAPDAAMAEASAGPEHEPMPRWVPRAIGLALVGFLLLGVLNWLFFRVKDLLVMLLVSLFLSFALEPAVNWLSSRGIRRGAATGLVFVGLLASVVVFLGALGTLVVQEVSDFVDEAPAYVEDLEIQINDTFGTDLNSDDLVASLTEADGPVSDFATRYAGNAVSIGLRAVGVLFQMLTIGLFTFYLVADGPRFRRVICSFLPPERQLTVLRNWELAIQKTGGYIYSRALLAGLSAVATFAFLEIIGVPYALALAIWVGLVSQFVPVVGTYLAGAFPVIIAVLDDPVDGLWVLGFIVVYQQIENY